MPRVPEWRDEPEQVWIICQEMRDLPQLDEFLVLFKVNGEQFTSFVPKRFVDHDKMAIRGAIIAEFNGDLLIDIPAETLTSGPRILVPISQVESVLTYT